jgi:hypothetical protein
VYIIRETNVNNTEELCFLAEKAVFRSSISSPGSKQLLTSCLFLAWLLLRLWKWRRHIPPKCQLTFNALHYVVAQKIELDVTTAVRISYPLNNTRAHWTGIFIYLFVYLFTYGLRKDAVSLWDCINSNGAMINEQRTTRESVEGIWRGLNWGTTPRFDQRSWRKSREIQSA